MIRKVLLAGSALALFTGVAVAAEPVVYVPPMSPPPPPAPIAGPVAMGSVGASYGWGNLNINAGGPGFDLDYNVIKFFGDANIPFGAWNLEIEGSGIGFRTDVPNPGNIDISLNTVEIGAHLYYRGPSFAAGAFVNYDDTSLLVTIDTTTIGAEAAFFWGSFILGAQAGFASAQIGNVVDLDGWYVAADARYFINPNLVVGADVQWTSWEDGDLEILSAGADIEYKMANNPLSVFAGARWDFGDLAVGPGINLDTFLINVGIRATLGGTNPTLWDNAKSGADTFTTAPLLFIAP